MRTELTIQNLEIEYEVEVPAIPGYLTVAEAAERLGVTGGRVRQLIAAEDLPSTKVGGVNLIPEEAFEEYQRTRRPVGWPKGKPRK